MIPKKPKFDLEHLAAILAVLLVRIVMKRTL